jgi:transcriptional regulator with AAA-type ATPase domain
MRVAEHEIGDADHRRRWNEEMYLLEVGSSPSELRGVKWEAKDPSYREEVHFTRGEGEFKTISEVAKHGASVTRATPGVDPPDRDTLVVRWVFPTEKTTSLVDGVVFGRDASATALLPGQEVSRQHAGVKRKGPIPTLRDLGSRNGTWVNGKRITKHSVAPNDVVRIGEWVGLVCQLGEEDGELGLREIGPNWYGGPTLARAVEPARRVASDLSVIVEGETGAGKAGMAAAIHAWSRRAGPFVAINCSAIPPAMAEAEFFGFKRGAFTGANRAGQGAFRAAHGGTLFLDEILELSPAVQAKLLRVLQEREVVPLGEVRPVRVDVRIVCATQEPLSQAVAERRFRADLHARLDGLTVVLPPLRARREDIVPLALHFLAEETSGRPPALDPKLVEALLLYDWPLNVRELVLLVRRLVAVHGQEATLQRSMLPDRMWKRVARADTSDDALFEQLVDALRQNRGNVARAAAALGISRARARRLLDARPEFDVRALRDDKDSGN